MYCERRRRERRKLGPIQEIICEKCLKISHVEFIVLRFLKNEQIHYFEILNQSTNSLPEIFSVVIITMNVHYRIPRTYLANSAHSVCPSVKSI